MHGAESSISQDSALAQFCLLHYPELCEVGFHVSWPQRFIQSLKYHGHLDSIFFRLGLLPTLVADGQ